MLQVVSPSLMRAIEEHAQAAGITQEMLMEEAGKAVASFTQRFVDEYHFCQKAYVVAGKGNNGGDAYVVARLLLQQGFTVHVLQVGNAEQGSKGRSTRKMGLLLRP
jgi:hydroxyethylthiazole kinase-like uncharacterized protein yjeF